MSYLILALVATVFFAQAVVAFWLASSVAEEVEENNGSIAKTIGTFVKETGLVEHIKGKE